MSLYSFGVLFFVILILKVFEKVKGMLLLFIWVLLIVCLFLGVFFCNFF